MTTLFMTTPTLPDDRREDGITYRVLSQPTTCLRCHLTVQMTYTEVDDSGRWTCPCCAHVYPAKYWKIKKARRVT